MGTFVLAVIVGLLVLLAIRFLFRKSNSEEMRRRIQPHIAQEQKRGQTQARAVRAS